MKKYEMFSVISKNTGLSLKACETLYNKLIIIIERTLEYESTIDISDFGVFKTRYRNEDMHDYFTGLASPIYGYRHH